MAISYNRLWKQLIDDGLSKTDRCIVQKSAAMF